MDCLFDGQTKAAIRTRVTGLTLIRPHIRNTPVGVSVDRDKSEQLWFKQGRLEHVSQAGYITGESDCRTYAADVQDDGTLVRGRLFAEQGGEGVTTDAEGKVYIAAGQIYVYSPDGKPLGTIEVPERPIHVTFGGPEGKTLFVAARTSLYSVHLP
jgi:hypothetical protein